MIARRPPVLVLLLTTLVGGCSAGAGPSVSPAPSATPAGTSAPSPDVASSPTADTGRGVTLSTAFLDLIRDPNARYRLDQTYVIVVGQGSTRSVSHTDVAGPDVMTITDLTSGETTTHTEYLQADGGAYEREGEEDWRELDAPGVRPPPFPFLKPEHLLYGGRQISGGEFLESLRLADAIPVGGAVAESLGVAGGTASVVVFDCFLQPDGSPVRVVLEYQLSGADGSPAGYGSIEQEYSEFGGDIVVEPPVG